MFIKLSLKSSHRGFIINTNFIESIEENHKASGSLIKLRDPDRWTRIKVEETIDKIAEIIYEHMERAK